MRRARTARLFGSEAGVSLVEMLVAMVAFGVLASGVHELVMTALRADDLQAAEIDLRQQAREASQKIAGWMRVSTPRNSPQGTSVDVVNCQKTTELCSKFLIHVEDVNAAGARSYRDVTVTSTCQGIPSTASFANVSFTEATNLCLSCPVGTRGIVTIDDGKGHIQEFPKGNFPFRNAQSMILCASVTSGASGRKLYFQADVQGAILRRDIGVKAMILNSTLSLNYLNNRITLSK